MVRATVRGMVRDSRRFKRGDRIPRWVWGGAVLLGVSSLGYGVWASLEGEGFGTRAPAPTGQAPTSELAPGPPAPVKPGTVTLVQDAPTTTEAPGSGALCSGCDVVLLTVCSLRRDYVGVYGEHPGLTPAIDRLAEGGYHFQRAYSASNFTLAGLTAILTGRFGSSTGVTGWDKGLVVEIPVLAEILGYYGYATGAFTIDAPSGFRPDYGLHRGFQRMEIIDPPRDNPDGRLRGRGSGTGEGGASAVPVSAWIRAQEKDKPIFAMFHSRTAHFPFVISTEGADEDETGITKLLFEAGTADARTRKAGQAMPGMAGGTGQSGVVELPGSDPLQVRMNEVGEAGNVVWRTRYAESVARMDKDVSAVMSALEDRGRLDRTVVILVADHGESLNDHGELLHGDAYYDTVVNVPLVMRVPGLPGRAAPIEGLVSHVDVLPTVLELIGAVAPAGIDGVSLLPLLRGDADSVRSTALVEGGVARQVGNVTRGAVVSLPWVLVQQARGCGGIRSQDACLFNVVADPGQTTNIASKHAPVVAELLDRWADFRAARATAGTQLSLDPRFVEELRKTGYDFGSPPK